MTIRVSYAPQDFQKMCKQAERDQEARKLAVLIERVKKQIAQRENAGLHGDEPEPPVTAVTTNSGRLRMFTRSAPFER